MQPRLVNDWLGSYRGATRDAYLRDLNHFQLFCNQRYVELLTVTRVFLNQYVRHMEDVEHLSLSTVARRLSALSSFYGFVIEEGVRTINPCALVKRPMVSNESASTGLSRAEVNRLIAVAKQDTDPRSYALVCLLTFTGLRISEALSLRRSDMRTEREHVVVDVIRKRGKRQVVPLVPQVVQALDALPPTASDYLFAGSKGQPWHRGSAWRSIARLAEVAGLPHIGPHSLRHTFVTLSLEAGVPLHEVQDAAGHADPRTTQRYNRARNRLDNAPSYRLADFIN